VVKGVNRKKGDTKSIKGAQFVIYRITSVSPRILSRNRERGQTRKEKYVTGEINPWVKKRFTSTSNFNTKRKSSYADIKRGG